MQQKFEKIRDLLVREKWDELTADERQMLEEWRQEEESHEQLYRRLAEPGLSGGISMNWRPLIRSGRWRTTGNYYSVTPSGVLCGGVCLMRLSWRLWRACGYSFPGRNLSLV